jgi:hypothetical protein
VEQFAYVLKLPTRTQEHNSFHALCLKKVVGQNVKILNTQQPLDDQDYDILILKHNLTTREETKE